MQSIKLLHQTERWIKRWRKEVRGKRKWCTRTKSSGSPTTTSSTDSFFLISFLFGLVLFIRECQNRPCINYGAEKKRGVESRLCSNDSFSFLVCKVVEMTECVCKVVVTKVNNNKKKANQPNNFQLHRGDDLANIKWRRIFIYV